MALSRQKKEDTVAEVAELLSNSKLTVFAKYQGTSVKSLQQLRRDSKENGTTFRVIKNRLFLKALESVENFDEAAINDLQGQILYGFNSSDEVAPAQALAIFAKTNPQIEFVGAISADGILMSADDVKHLASLPTKDQLRGQLVGLIASPLSGFTAVMAGNVRGVLNVLSARAEVIN